MDRGSAVKFEGQSRVHIGLEVADLERSVEFYRVLFGADPVKRRAGYAKFESGVPSVNLSLNEGRGGRSGRPGGSQHFGVQVQSTGAVERMVERFRAAGIAVRIEEGIACCYAVQDKAWVEDPDSNPWEVFVVVQADVDQRAPASSTCCGAAPTDLEGALADAEGASADPEGATNTCCGGA